MSTDVLVPNSHVLLQQRRQLDQRIVNIRDNCDVQSTAVRHHTSW